MELFTAALAECGNFMIFHITQILREINFRDCRCANSAILRQLKDLNLNLYDIFHFL